MKIEFADGSFIQIEETQDNLTIIQCAKKANKVIMSSVELDIEQVKKISTLLVKWLERKKNE